MLTIKKFLLMTVVLSVFTLMSAQPADANREDPLKKMRICAEIRWKLHDLERQMNDLIDWDTEAFDIISRKTAALIDERNKLRCPII